MLLPSIMQLFNTSLTSMIEKKFQAYRLNWHLQHLEIFRDEKDAQPVQFRNAVLASPRISGKKWNLTATQEKEMIRPWWNKTNRLLDTCPLFTDPQMIIILSFTWWPGNYFKSLAWLVVLRYGLLICYVYITCNGFESLMSSAKALLALNEIGKFGFCNSLK